MKTYERRDRCVVCDFEMESSRILNPQGRVIKPPLNTKKLLGKNERVCSIFCSNVLWNQYVNSDSYVVVKRKYQNG